MLGRMGGGEGGDHLLILENLEKGRERRRGEEG